MLIKNLASIPACHFCQNKNINISYDDGNLLEGQINDIMKLSSFKIETIARNKNGKIGPITLEIPINSSNWNIIDKISLGSSPYCLLQFDINYDCGHVSYEILQGLQLKKKMIVNSLEVSEHRIHVMMFNITKSFNENITKIDIQGDDYIEITEDFNNLLNLSEEQLIDFCENKYENIEI